LHNNEKIYKVHKFKINVEIISDKIKIIIIVAIITFIIIVFIILTIILIKMKKKNKELEEKVNNISFRVGDNISESSDDELHNRVSYI
jgi:pilus assembly protein TadC